MNARKHTMSRFHMPAIALIISATLVMTACGSSQDSESSASKEVKGLLEVPTDQANEQAGKKLAGEVRLNLANARGRMAGYMIIVKKKGSDSMQRKAVELKEQFKSEAETIGEDLLPKMTEADNDTLSDLVERYNEIMRDHQQTLSQAKDLKKQALGTS